MFKKLLLAVSIILATSSTQAVEIRSQSCEESGGDIQADIRFTTWDRLFHEKVIIGVKDIYGNRNETSYDIFAWGTVYDANINQFNLPYTLSTYYIGTDKGTLFEGPCQ